MSARIPKCSISVAGRGCSLKPPPSAVRERQGSISRGVVALARQLVPSAEFVDGNALDLPFADNSFDAVVCGYGIMHLPDPERGLREMLRVLHPGGHVALTVWDHDPKSGIGLIHKAIHDFADLNVPMPHAPGLFQFSSFEKMRDALKGVGFGNTDATLFPQVWQLESAQQLIDAIREGTVRTRALLAVQTPNVLARITTFVDAGLAEARTRDGGYGVPMPAIIGSGSKP